MQNQPMSIDWERIWDATGPRFLGEIRLPYEGPLDWYAGWTEKGHPRLLLRTTVEPKKLSSSTSIEVTITHRKEDSSWFTSLELLDDSVLEVFIKLCNYLVVESMQTNSTAEALQIISRRFREWTRLLQEGKSHLLNKEQVRGLAGELFVLEDLLKGSDNPVNILQGWHGPEDGAQDFWLEESWLEVKSILPGGKTVSISSFEQLDSDVSGTLIVQRIKDADSASLESLNLPQLINRIECQLESNLDAKTTFKNKLRRAGFNQNRITPLIENYYFLLVSTEYYKVDGDFPRIRRSEIPSQINTGKYTILLEPLANFKIDSAEL